MAERIRSADEMLNLVRGNAIRLDAIKADPLPELEKLRTDALEKVQGYVGDTLIYRIAVIVLGSLAVIAALGSILLVMAGKDTPEVLVALGSAAVGALVGLFAPSPTGK